MKKEIMKELFNEQKNLIVEGDFASGKTSNVLFPVVENAINNKESLLILDSKEEYLKRYYKKLKEKDYNIIILNLKDMDKSDGWNPLEYPYNLYKRGDKDKAQYYIEKIANVMHCDNSSRDPFWDYTSSDFFTGVTLGLFEDGKADEINFNSVNNIFNDNKKIGPSDLITEYFKTKDTSSNSYIFASSTVIAPQETRYAILAVAKQKLRLFVSREKLSQLMRKTTFIFDDIANKPTAIFVIARNDNKALNSVASMFIEQLYAILVDLKAENKFNFILDNFDVIEKCNDLVDILRSCIFRNIKTYIATISVEELVKVYGSYLTKLCDILSIEKSKIKLVSGQTQETFDKEFATVKPVECSVEYPLLNKADIKVFDFEKFVRGAGHHSENADLNELSSYTPADIDKLIMEIDEKIEKLEAEERKEKEEKKN